MADPLARDRRRRPDGPRRQRPPHRRPRRDAVLARQPGQLRDPRLDRHACPEPWQPTFAYIDIDPGEKTTWEETLVLARLYRTALGHLGVRGYPKTTGKRGIQVWIPIVPKYAFGETSALGRAGLAGGRRRPSRTSSPGSGRRRRARARPASTTPRTHHQDARRAVFGAAGGGRPGLGADHLGRAGRPGPAARPLDDPDDRRPRRRARATCSRRPRPTRRSCRQV